MNAEIGTPVVYSNYFQYLYFEFGHITTWQEGKMCQTCTLFMLGRLC